MVFCHPPYGPLFLSMLVFVVRGIVYLCNLCVYFLDFTLLLFSVCPCPSLFLGVAACSGWKYIEMVLLCVLCWGRLTLLLLTCEVSTVSSILLLLHMSTPLPVHRIRMHSFSKGGSIAEVFRLSTIRIGCACIHSRIVREYVFSI